MVSPVRCAISRGLAAAALVLAAAALAAPAAQAGQVVWVAAARSGGGALLAANDDGTYPHQLLSASSASLVAMAPGGTIADPDAFQLGGTSIVFTDAMSAWNTPAGTA